MESALYIGLMSGTSMDGVDAVIAQIDNDRFKGIRAHTSQPYPSDLQTALMRVALEAPALTLAEVVDLDIAVADCFAATAKQVLEVAALDTKSIRAIGSHGQTIFHRPGGDAPSSLQLGDPNRISAHTGLTTVADFRRRDMAEGGQGAPLVPAFHHAVFANKSEPRCVANIGGIANVTLLPDESRTHVVGYDTGPGNGLMDEWARRHLGTPHDEAGRWASTGSVHAGLYESLIEDDYFRALPPKSSGRDYFNLAWALGRYPQLETLPPQDVQRTFCELTAQTIAAAAMTIRTQRLLICGGGGANEFLLQRLRAGFRGSVELTNTHGLDAVHVEAAAFAWLAMRTLNGLTGNLPSVTGARREVILGGTYR